MNIKLPYNLVIFFLLIFLFQCSHLSVYSQDTSFLKKRIPFPNCENLSYKSCIESKIKNAEFVFEGTVVDFVQRKDSQGNLLYETTYEINKVFKGKLKQGRVKRISDTEKILKFYRDFYTKNGLSVPNGFSRLKPKIGDIGIVVANKSLTEFEKYSEQLENPILLEEPLDLPILVYELGYDNYYLEENQECIFYSIYGGEEVCFKTSTEIYSFIMKSLNTERYIDISNRHFEKMDKQEWIKHKSNN